MKKWSIVLLLAMFAFVTACSSSFVDRRTTGIPYSSSQGFFFNMKQVSLDSGYDVTEDDTSLTVHVGKFGWLQYVPGNDGSSIDVVAFAKNKGKEGEQAQRERAEKIMAIHEELIAKARKLAESNQMFR